MKGSKGVQTINRAIRKKKNSRTKNSVKKMVSMMSTPNSEQPSTSADDSHKHVDDFLSTGRTGRRNALPDILNDHSLVSSSELPSQLEALTTKDNDIDPNKPSTSREPDKIG